MKSTKWQLVSEDKDLVFDMNVNLIGQNDKVVSTGMVFYRGKEQAIARIESEDFFKKPKKKKMPKTAIAYALAHHIALYMTGGKVTNADKLVCEWFGLNYDESTERTIKRARNKYFKPPKGSCFLMHAEPPGLTVLLEPKNIRINDSVLSYSGQVWSWREGQKEAYMGPHSFVVGDQTNPPLLIEPPEKYERTKR
ncbi:MAG: hypothetical protein ACU837_03970 [Gammaproteobacteria bacterium]